MSVAIKKIEGVESVRVSLNEGWADVKLRPGNTVTVSRIRDAVRANGFTPKEARIRARGRVIEREGRPALLVSGSGAVYVLSLPTPSLGEAAREALEKGVVVEGAAPETSKAGAEPGTLEVRSLTRR